MKDCIKAFQEGWAKAWHMSGFSERLRITRLLKQYALKHNLNLDELIEQVKRK